MTVTVLGPLRPDEEENEQSLVLRVEKGDEKLLVTGDIGAETEHDIIQYYDNLLSAVDIVSIPHHGSAYSSSEDFVSAIRPAYATAQAGRNNRYGHPAEEVLLRWENAGSRVFRSDRSGTIGFGRFHVFKNEWFWAQTSR